MPATLDATEDPFADLIPEGSGNLGVTPEPINPFADLLVSETPATDAAIKALPDHSAKWNAEQKVMAEAAAAAGLPPAPSGNARLVDAIQRSHAAGYPFPHFSGPDSVDPRGDRTVTLDMEELVRSLSKQEVDASDPEAKQRIAREKDYWSNESKTHGMTLAQWRQQTGQGDPIPGQRPDQPELIGGGTADAPAIQKVGQNFSPVPRGVAVSTTDYGPFSDLAGDGLLPPMDVTERQFGPFDDLVPQVAPESEKAVLETPEKPYPTSGFSPIDLIKQPQWLLNLNEGLAETIRGLIPQEPQDLVKLLTPVATLPEQAKKTFGLVRDWMGGKSLTEAEAANFPESQILTDADKTAPFSKERFAAGFGMLAQMGMLAIGGRGLAKPSEAVPIPEKPVAPPTTLETRLPLSQDLSTLEPPLVTPEQTISQPATGGGEIQTTAVPQGAADLPAAARQIEVAVRTKSGEVYSIPNNEGVLHAQVVEKRGINANDIKDTGYNVNGVYQTENPLNKLGDLSDAEYESTVKFAVAKRQAESQAADLPENLPRAGEAVEPDYLMPSGRLDEGKMRPAMLDKSGKVRLGSPDEHHSDIRTRVYGEGVQPMLDETGWVLGNDKSTFVSLTDFQNAKGDPDLAFRTKYPEKFTNAGDPAPVVEPQFTPSAKVKSILEKQPVPKPGIPEPEPAPEGGALFSAGGKRPPKTAPVGDTPMGDKNWLRIPSWLKRAGRGLMTEGARGTLGRVKNQVGQALAKATRQHVDIEQELYGKHENILREAIQSVPKERADAAFTEASQFISDKENGRTPTPLQPDAQKILDAWYEVGRKTGDIARANNVQVFDRKTGAYRPMGTVKDYIPRMFRPEVEKALRDPQSDVPLFNRLADDIAKQRGITPVEAAEELRGVSGRFAANDHMANLELARSEQLPESFYEYDLRNLAARYLPSFSERMAQIIAYGQRLGPREAPLKQNLWDVARREAQDTDTQQWLNDAEDQATGFHPKSPINRNVRRAQALGNATLLSDPTTTVMRNLLSGLTVTTERFGVGRSLRQLSEAGKHVNRMAAREIGVLRDDIGNFLGAEQLGDSKLDTFIREVQQKALKVSGFTGSETLVRTHNAMTASAFARDAAAALATKPKSALAREGLAMFKKLDVDPEKIVAEKGDWKTGPETRKFIRSTVRESQGGYRFDQVPIWAGSSAGRFLYQYGRWAIQRSGDIFRNTIKPAIGESVEFRGQRMTRRNVMPLIRLGLGVVGLGETFGGIASVLFGRDRKDASFSEIGEAFSEDESKAVGLLAERITNDIIMAGTLGLLSQPIDFIKSTKDQSRFKNPAEPPSMAGIKALGALAQKAWDQGGTLTRRDWLDAATAFARGPKNVTDVARHAAGEQLYESQNDQRTLRNAARRWGKEHNLDMSQAGGFGDFRKSPNAPTFEAINDALLSGDAKKAQQVARDFIRSSPDKDKAKKAVLSSVEGKSPFRAGPFSADKYRDSFLKWSKKNLSTDDQEQVLRVMRLYQRTARAAGLLD